MRAGPGVHLSGKGQISSQGELLLCTIQALLNSKKTESADQQVSQFYGKWLDSHPFDVDSSIYNVIY